MSVRDFMSDNVITGAARNKDQRGGQHDEGK